MKKRKGYTLYVECGEKKIEVMRTYSGEVIDLVYATYIDRIKKGLCTYGRDKNKIRVSKVYVVREWDNTVISYSLEEGYREVEGRRVA